MRKIAFLAFILLGLTACNNDDSGETPQDVQVNFTFSENWDGEDISTADYETTVYTNAHGETLTLSKLVYLISDVTFTATDGTEYDAGDYFLVEADETEVNSFTPAIEIPEGTYTVSFTFGFDDEDNVSGIYNDLNSADGGWNVPDPLGGGYHYMRMEGRYMAAGSTDEVSFQYHTIRANKHTTLPPGPGTLEFTEDTSFEVSLGQIAISEGTTITINMNVAEWFKNPEIWDLTELFTILMPNYEAQIKMNKNGKAGVFSLGEITQ